MKRRGRRESAKGAEMQGHTAMCPYFLTENQEYEKNNEKTAAVPILHLFYTYFTQPELYHHCCYMSTDLKNILASLITGFFNSPAVPYFPFPSLFPDVDFEANLLHHVELREATVKEMLRVSRSKVVFIEPNILNPLMFLFGLLYWAERCSLVFTPRYVNDLLKRCGVHVIDIFATGMRFQNHTPAFLCPV